MKLRCLEEGDFPLAAKWLSDPENVKWLRFGPGVETLSAAALRVMVQRNVHMLRVYSAEDDAPPVGLVALSDVDRGFQTATLWCVLGDRAHRGRGLTTRAVSRMLTEGFATGLTSINAWIVDGNVPSILVLQRNRFRLIGRQRMCHPIDGRARGRLLFDLLASEHRELP